MTDTAVPLGLVEALVLGIIQGITEFLPISSTAHLRVVPALFGWDDPGVSVTAAIQLGSIIATTSYFHQDLSRVLRGISRAIRYGQWQDPEARLGIAMASGNMPILLLGLGIKMFWHQEYDGSPLRTVPSIAVISIVMALFLAFAECVGSQIKRLDSVNSRDGLVVGCAQALAVVPGVSRSGSTLTASLFDGWKRADAARFSFLLSIPAISVAGLVELKSALDVGTTVDPLSLIVGIISATLVSWLSIGWLLHFLQQNSSWIFVVYRLIFGSTLLVWWVVSSAH
ncbi:undecaprenyl-diphosphate phosphatase [Synechococcus sp. M16CYN]|uniref:undecaprenyl-diphosphate phosphatase n=1 Tax=Synechococcus sp. M16CYN TaxID=3103139 RepID=UPI0030DFE99F